MTVFLIILALFFLWVLIYGLIYLYRGEWLAMMLRWGIFFSAVLYLIKTFPVILAVIWSPIAICLLLFGFREITSGIKILRG